MSSEMFFLPLQYAYFLWGGVAGGGSSVFLFCGLLGFFLSWGL